MMDSTHWARSEHASHAPRVAATATALPRHHYSQRELADVARELFPSLSMDPKLLERFFRRVGVKERYLALPAKAYRHMAGLRSRNEAYLEVALELGQEAVCRALARAELHARDVGMFMTTTVTGIAVPSLDARLMNRIPFAPTLKRLPLFGLGCLAGAAGVARAAEYLRAFPDHAAVLLSVELCSLTVQRDDASVANIISSGLFGDGAAAVVLVGDKHPLSTRPGPRVLDSRSQFFANTERVMGWDVVDGGFKVVLSPEVPQLANEQVPLLVDALLGRHGLARSDISAWIAHPGGPAVMEAMRKGLGLAPELLEPTRRSLAAVGNLSSASVLFLLDEHCRTLTPPPGGYGLMIAMGPAFCAEGVLLQW